MSDTGIEAERKKANKGQEKVGREEGGEFRKK